MLRNVPSLRNPIAFTQQEEKKHFISGKCKLLRFINMQNNFGEPENFYLDFQWSYVLTLT